MLKTNIISFLDLNRNQDGASPKLAKQSNEVNPEPFTGKLNFSLNLGNLIIQLKHNGTYLPMHIYSKLKDTLTDLELQDVRRIVTTFNSNFDPKTEYEFTYIGLREPQSSITDSSFEEMDPINRKANVLISKFGKSEGDNKEEVIVAVIVNLDTGKVESWEEVGEEPWKESVNNHNNVDNDNSDADDDVKDFSNEVLEDDDDDEAFMARLDNGYVY